MSGELPWRKRPPARIGGGGAEDCTVCEVVTERSRVELTKSNEAVYESLVRMLETENRACVVQPCGTGKSYIGFKLAQDNPGKRVLWMAPGSYIFEQQTANLGRVCPGASLENVEQMTYHKVWSLLKRKRLHAKADIVILDEFHRCGAKCWRKGVDALLASNPRAKVVGLSATKVRASDGLDMVHELFGGRIAHEEGVAESIERGVLQRPIYIRALYDDGEGVLAECAERIDGMPRDSRRDEAEEAYEDIRRHLEDGIGIDGIMQRHIAKKNAKLVVFCRSIDALEAVAGRVRGWFRLVNDEINIYKVHTGNPDGDAEFTRFRHDGSRAIKLMLCVNQLNEGVHVPEVDGVVMVRPTQSSTVYFQQMGRAFDVGTTKVPMIFDLVNNILENNWPTLHGNGGRKAVAQAEPERDDGGAEDAEREREPFDVYDYTCETVELMEKIARKERKAKSIDELIADTVEFYKKTGLYDV